MRATPTEIGKPSFRAHAAADRCSNLGGRPKEMCAARYIGKRLVDRNPLDERCVITEDLDRGIAEPLIILEMTADKSELWA